jgi:hypothetical protein
MYNSAHREREKASHLRLCEPAGGAQLHPPIVGDPPNFSEMGEKDGINAHLKNITGWCPPVISWFINPINYSYIYHKP